MIRPVKMKLALHMVVREANVPWPLTVQKKNSFFFLSSLFFCTVKGQGTFAHNHVKRVQRAEACATDTLHSAEVAKGPVVVDT